MFNTIYIVLIGVILSFFLYWSMLSGNDLLWFRMRDMKHKTD